MTNLLKKVLFSTTSLLLLAACGASNGSAESTESTDAGSTAGTETITMVWYPNESGADMAISRDQIGKYIEEATGKKVEHQLTTDYAIAIETIANGKANLAFMGAQGYVEAHNKNDKVLPLVVPSGKSGTLEDAIYYSWLNVKKGNEDQYKDASGEYSIDNIKGKKMSFVSNSSTSGFVVPTSGIISHFASDNLKAEDLMEGGSDKFFSEVLFGGSHQGSAVNLLMDKADVAAFCDTCVANYVEPAEGEVNKVGTTYKVKDGAADPFTSLVGQEFVSIGVTPVLNAPMAVNTEVTSEEDVAKILEVFTGETLNNDELIWRPEDSEAATLFEKNGDSKFVSAEDAWFNPIRELTK